MSIRPTAVREHLFPEYYGAVTDDIDESLQIKTDMADELSDSDETRDDSMDPEERQNVSRLFLINSRVTLAARETASCTQTQLFGNITSCILLLNRVLMRRYHSAQDLTYLLKTKMEKEEEERRREHEKTTAAAAAVSKVQITLITIRNNSYPAIRNVCVILRLRREMKLKCLKRWELLVDSLLLIHIRH